MSDIKNNLNLEDKTQSVDDLLKENKSYRSLVEALKGQIAERDRDLRALQDECLRKDSEIIRLTNSRGYRLLLKYYKVRETLIPNGSKRYAVIRTLLYPLIWLLKKSNRSKSSFNVVTRDEGFRRMKYCERIGIITTEHTRYIANIIKDCLGKCGLKGEIYINSVEEYEDIPYIIVCPQFLKKFPRLYAVVQMEQTVSTRWMTQEYLNILRNAYAVFDYSMVNIKYFGKDPIISSKLFYLPVDSAKIPIASSYEGEKEYDVLFYGAPYVERRQQMLDKLKEKYNVKIICDKFGPELYAEMQKAKVVINIHYYANALLETTRIYETLSVGSSVVVSERSTDPEEEKRLEGIVDFVPVDDIDALCDRVGYWIEHDEEREAKVEANNLLLRDRANALEFYLARFLLANERISFNDFYEKFGDFIEFDNNKICLSLPECTERRDAFTEDNKYGFEFFPGLKHHLGWVGCAMSYKFICKKALDSGMQKLLVCEDDVYFPEDFDKRFENICDYMKGRDDWDVFSGIMADVGRVKVLECGDHNGEQMVYLDRMISMVFNLYNPKSMELIADWNEIDHNTDTNAIDRYLENKSLRVLTTAPFLVGHKEDLQSTIWGQQNTIYSALIEKSSEKIQKLVNDYKAKN